MKYIRKAEYTWTDYKTNTEIAKELNTTPVLDKIQEYRRNWLQHINRNAPSQINVNTKTLQINRQKKLGETIKETSKCERQ